MSGVGIHWFRKDLRLHDNRALLKSIEQCSTLIPLYILNTEFLSPSIKGVNQMSFLLDSLKSLDEELRQKGSRLYVSKGKPCDVLTSVVQDYNAQYLTFQKDTEPYNRIVDDSVLSLCKTSGVNVTGVWGHTLYDPEYLLELNDGKAPLTMTSFLSLVGRAGVPLSPVNAPDTIPPPPDTLPPPPLQCGGLGDVPVLSDLKEYGYNPEEKTTWFVSGEKEAIKKMEDFLAQKKRVAGFEKPKTNPTALEPDTTALSPYITWGSLSVRLFYNRLMESVKGSTITKPPVSLKGQLYWREMAYLIGYSTPNFNQMVDNPICRQIPWMTGDAAKPLLAKWEIGQTGYPAVDAAMNQLRTDGWMHHLARHLVACFLTRGDLWVSWELGRDVFDKYLVDADWSINNFSWHWLSCSAFFHQYFRCYGPTTFFKKTDPTGAYIRKHVPILAKYPNKYIYEPWMAPITVQETAGCIVGKDYPSRIVDHAIVSKANMGKMKKAYAEGKGATASTPPRKKAKMDDYFKSE